MNTRNLETCYVVYNGILCFEFVKVVEVGILTKSGLTRSCKKDNAKNVVRGCNCTKALYEFNPLNERLKSKIINVFGLPPKVINK